MLLLLCSAWILAYAGIFFLGFGGSRWTSDMAINYFKTVLGVGVQLMTMTLIVGVGTGFINEYHAKMSTAINMEEIGILFVSALTLFMLTDKLPAMVAGIINGASVGGHGCRLFWSGCRHWRCRSRYGICRVLNGGLGKNDGQGSHRHGRACVRSQGSQIGTG